MVRFPLAIYDLGMSVGLSPSPQCRGDYNVISTKDFNSDGRTDQLEKFKASYDHYCALPVPYRLALSIDSAIHTMSGESVPLTEDLEYAKIWVRPTGCFIAFRTRNPFEPSGPTEIKVKGGHLKSGGTPLLAAGDLVSFVRGGVTTFARVHRFQIELDMNDNWARSAAMLGIPEIDRSGGIPLSELTVESSGQKIEQKAVAVESRFKKDLKKSLDRRGSLLNKAYYWGQCLSRSEAKELKQIEREIRSYVLTQADQAFTDEAGKQLVNQQLSSKLDSYLRAHDPCTTVAKR